MTRYAIADAVDSLLKVPLPLRFTAYDGSATGPEDSPYRIHLATERGLSYLLTAPGDLGFARAYVSGDLELHGVHPGDPYAAFRLVQSQLSFRRPTPAELVDLARSLGLSRLRPVAPPPQEAPARWRRTVEGWRHSLGRDAEAIHHHYDVSNAFYEHVLGPSMTYTCAVFPRPDASLEGGSVHQVRPGRPQARPATRPATVGPRCGWGGMVRHAAREYGVRAIGVTLSREQATWANQQIKEERLDHLAEVRFQDYRLVEETGFDAISSIGLTEHIGVRNYASYFAFVRDHLRPQGRLLNHCITRHDNTPTSTGQFLDRYVVPDGELTGSGRIITEVQDAGLEVQHEENIRVHYALTLAAWCQNLVDHWDECVAEVGEATAKVWGLYMAGSRIAFERNDVQLHHVLATRNDDGGASGFPLRPNW